MVKVSIALLLFMYTIGTASCSKVSESNSSGLAEIEGAPVVVNSDSISEITYFHGGWYGPSNVPNWSHDITFSFNENGNATIDAKIPEDKFCGKAGSLNTDAKTELINKINSLKLGFMDFGMIDAGVSMLILKTKAGEITRIYFPGSDFIGEDQLYILDGGDELRSHILKIYDGLTMYCQSIL